MCIFVYMAVIEAAIHSSNVTCMTSTGRVQRSIATVYVSQAVY